jgi:hypothetical protein
MSLQIKGKLIKALPLEKGVSKAGKEWQKQSFVIDSGDQFNPEICFSMFGEDKIKSLKDFKAGQEVEVSFNLQSKEYNGKYYTSAECWKIVATNEQIVRSVTTPQLESSILNDVRNGVSEEEMPF